MIDWVDSRLKEWGAAKRKVLNGATAIAPPLDGHRCHVSRSFFGRITDEGPVGAAIHTPAKPLEVLRGRPLATGRAIRLALERRNLKERQYQVICAHYIFRGTARNKARFLKISESYYHRVKSSSHYAISGLLGSCDTEHEKLQELEGIAQIACI